MPAVPHSSLNPVLIQLEQVSVHRDQRDILKKVDMEDREEENETEQSTFDFKKSEFSKKPRSNILIIYFQNIVNVFGKNKLIQNLFIILNVFKYLEHHLIIFKICLKYHLF